MTAATLHHGDCLDVLKTLPDASVDSICTDPPYGLAEHKPATITAAMVAWCSGDRDHVPDGRGFMGRAWDGFVPPPAVWDECLRVLKPGGHLLAFAGSRTADLMGLSVRLAGFEIRDTIVWHYGSGFPKSLDVSKAIDKAAGAEREVIGQRAIHYADTPSGYTSFSAGGGVRPGGIFDGSHGERAAGRDVTAPATPAAQQWTGWGTALKPASEPIIVARKPLTGTVAANVLAHGTGALNIDATRVGAGGHLKWSAPRDIGYMRGGTDTPGAVATESPAGRWPSNVVFTHAPQCGPDETPGECVDGCPVAELDAQSGITRGYGGQGGASRFFPTFRYQAKAPSKERPKVDGVAHPTVKPLALMRWLVRLVTPPGGTVLDPFAGSGTTLQAAREEGFAAVGVEREAAYLPLIGLRLGEGLAVAEHGKEEAAEPVVEPEPEPVDPVLQAIHEAELTRAAFNALHREHRLVWTDAHTAAARARLDAAGVSHR